MDRWQTEGLESEGNESDIAQTALKRTKTPLLGMLRKSDVSDSIVTLADINQNLKNEAVRKEKEDSLAPLFLFLTSSLNVELVYVILYGISQFSLLNLINKGNEGLNKD